MKFDNIQLQKQWTKNGQNNFQEGKKLKKLVLPDITNSNIAIIT